MMSGESPIRRSQLTVGSSRRLSVTPPKQGSVSTSGLMVMRMRALNWMLATSIGTSIALNVTP